MHPCKSTYDICKYVETFLKSIEDKNISIGCAKMTILRNIPFESLYTSSDFAGHIAHKYNLVKLIVEIAR